jgi:predicted metal-dependent enzyme (double-stranded beta helix superfamily)
MPSEPISRRSMVIGAAGSLTTKLAFGQGHGKNPTATVRFDIDRFVDDVKRARAESESQLAVEEVLKRTLSAPDAVLTGLGAPATAGIHSIHRDAELTILNVIWAPLMVLLPHNHNMWASIGIYTGREDNILWQRQGGSIQATGAAALSAKEVFGLPADAIHSVTNPIGRLTGAIHIYGGDFFAPGRSEWDPERLEERPWDLQAARREFRKAANRFDAAP